MTEAIYLDDATVRRTEATVERVDGDRVVLDRTVFYPAGGGQPADHGTLAVGDRTLPVTDVRGRDRIEHVVDGDPPEAGDRVVATIDWDRRHAHMRYHTAQHLLSAILLSEYGAETTGNQLYADYARLDCAYDRFDADDCDRIEARMNDRVDDALPVRWYELDRETAAERLDPERTRLDLLPAGVDPVRIVEIEGVDRTACGGTHVPSTEEIGRVRVTGRETRGSGEERLRFELE